MLKKRNFCFFSEKNAKLNLENLQLKIGEQTIEQVGSNCNEKYFKFVGHVLDDKFTWTGHVEHICKKLASANFAINSTKHFLPKKVRKTLYYSLFDSHLNFGNLLWGCCDKKLLGKIEVLQKRCIRNIALKSFKAHTEPIFKELEILKFSDKLAFSRSVFVHQYRNNKLPTSFSGIFSDIVDTSGPQTRQNDLNFLNPPSTKRYLDNFPYKQMLSNWNHLNIDLKSTSDAESFKQMLKESFLSSYSCDSQCIGHCYACGT